MFRTITSAFAALAIIAAAVAPASADPARHAVSVRVSYADLDLSRIEGVKTLTARIENALNKACGRTQARVPQNVRRNIQACRKAGMETAVASIDAPLLTAFHADRQGTQVAAR